MTKRQPALGLAALTLLVAAGLGTGFVSGQEQEKDKEVATGPKPPAMEIEAAVIDVGEIVVGQDANATFVVRNTGGETLEILKAKPG